MSDTNNVKPAFSASAIVLADAIIGALQQARDVWNVMRERFTGLSVDEADKLAKETRELVSAGAAKLGISEKGTSVYLSEMLRCVKGGKEIPESRSAFVKAVKAGEIPKTGSNRGAKAKVAGSESEPAAPNSTASDWALELALLTAAEAQGLTRDEIREAIQNALLEAINAKADREAWTFEGEYEDVSEDAETREIRELLAMDQAANG